MIEISSGRLRGWWWRVSYRTHGITLGVFMHWPTRGWHQYQIGVLMLDLTWGRVTPV